MRRCALVCVLAGLFAMPAWGVVLFNDVAGQVNIVGQIGDAGLPANEYASFTRKMVRPSPGTFHHVLQDSIGEPTLGSVSAMATQLSSFDLVGNELLGASFAGTGAVTASTFAPYGSNTLAFSQNRFTFEVVGEPVVYDIVISFATLGSADAEAYLTLQGASSTIVESRASTSPSGNVVFQGQLQPGQYTLDSFVRVGVLAPTQQAVALANSMVYTVSFAPVPEPASLGLLALGGLGLLLRRRRR